MNSGCPATRGRAHHGIDAEAPGELPSPLPVDRRDRPHGNAVRSVPGRPWHRVRSTTGSFDTRLPGPICASRPGALRGQAATVIIRGDPEDRALHPVEAGRQHLAGVAAGRAPIAPRTPDLPGSPGLDEDTLQCRGQRATVGDNVRRGVGTEPVTDQRLEQQICLRRMTKGEDLCGIHESRASRHSGTTASMPATPAGVLSARSQTARPVAGRRPPLSLAVRFKVGRRLISVQVPRKAVGVTSSDRLGFSGNRLRPRRIRCGYVKRVAGHLPKVSTGTEIDQQVTRRSPARQVARFASPAADPGDA
ncbi:MAG: hypothetical protein RL030_1033 [Pseudomonadota bacterium]